VLCFHCDAECCYAECCYAECYLLIVMLSVVFHCDADCLLSIFKLIVLLLRYAVCFYAECKVFIVMLIVDMLSLSWASCFYFYAVCL
jgi:hypothetical protein